MTTPLSFMAYGLSII